MKAKWYIALLLIAVCAACGSKGTEAGAESNEPDHVIQAFEVVPLSPGSGEGAPVAVTASRLTAAGDLQILVDGFSCGVPTKLDLEESPDSVSVTAYATRFTEEGCPADIVPWYLSADLVSLLAGRTLVSAETGKPVRVVDCRADPESDDCER